MVCSSVDIQLCITIADRYHAKYKLIQHFVTFPSPSLIATLNTQLQRMLPDARLRWQVLPQCPAIGLWLLDPDPLRRAFTSDEIATIETFPAYWAFCWASGQWLARYLLDQPEIVRDKRVLDFGAGSGVAGIAAAIAGASQVTACDIDVDAITASRLNAQANRQEARLEYAGDVFALTQHFEVVLAADVLYDRANLPLLDHLLKLGDEVWVADSRIRDFNHPAFEKIMVAESFTFPDLDESAEFRCVTIYRGQRK